MSVTQDYCRQIQCGVIPQDSVSPEDLWACTQLVGGGVLLQSDPKCRDYYPTQTGPLAYSDAAIALHPTVAVPLSLLPQTPTSVMDIPDVPVLTAQNIVQPLPDITQALMPTQAPECSFWSVLNQEIAKYPLWSVGILLGVFFVFHGGSKRR